MGDRRILSKLKRNVLSSCVTPALMNALDRMALTEKQQKVQVCETQSGGWNEGTFYKETGEQQVDMGPSCGKNGDEKLAKRTHAQKVMEKRRRGDRNRDGGLH